MTAGRAALVELVRQYTAMAVTGPAQIETQKLMYFLQVAGEPLRLDFAPIHYGPHADNLRHVLDLIEGHFVVGYGEGSRAAQDSEPLALVPAVIDESARVLDTQPQTRERIARVLAEATARRVGHVRVSDEHPSLRSTSSGNRIVRVLGDTLDHEAS